MIHAAQRLVESLLLAAIDAIPDSWMRHLLFKVGANRQLVDRWGYHIRAINYGDPLPDFRKLKRREVERRRRLLGIEFAIAEQVRMACELGRAYGDELAAVRDIDGPFDFTNSWFTGLDAGLYYSLIRQVRPQRVVEVGCGFSSRLAAAALSRNGQGELICIEPYPQPRFLDAKLKVRLIEAKVQEVPLELFTSLSDNDILFVDSSHAGSYESDVYHVFLEILPRLQRGVWIHFHDIFFPTDYPAEWLIDNRLAFNEQYLLAAFLQFNREFQPQFAARWLWLDHEIELRQIWPHRIFNSAALSGSFWMRRTQSQPWVAGG